MAGPVRDLLLDMNGRSLQNDFDKAPDEKLDPPAIDRLHERADVRDYGELLLRPERQQRKYEDRRPDVTATVEGPALHDQIDGQQRYPPETLVQTVVM